MSWSFYANNEDADMVAERIASDPNLPESIRAYLWAGVEALQKRFDGSVPVNISSSGHLFTGDEGNYDVTSATITIQRGVAAEAPATTG